MVIAKFISFARGYHTFVSRPNGERVNIVFNPVQYEQSTGDYIYCTGDKQIIAALKKHPRFNDAFTLVSETPVEPLKKEVNAVIEEEAKPVVKEILEPVEVKAIEPQSETQQESDSTDNDSSLQKQADEQTEDKYVALCPDKEHIIYDDTVTSKPLAKVFIQDKFGKAFSEQATTAEQMRCEAATLYNVVFKKWL